MPDAKYSGPDDASGEEMRRDDIRPGWTLYWDGAGRPALWRAEKIQSKAAKAGFDWDDWRGECPHCGAELQYRKPRWVKRYLTSKDGHHEKIDWVKKLTSTKLGLAIADFVSRLSHRG